MRPFRPSASASQTTFFGLGPSRKFPIVKNDTHFTILLGQGEPSCSGGFRRPTSIPPTYTTCRGNLFPVVLGEFGWCLALDGHSPPRRTRTCLSASSRAFHYSALDHSRPKLSPLILSMALPDWEETATSILHSFGRLCGPWLCSLPLPRSRVGELYSRVAWLRVLSSLASGSGCPARSSSTTATSALRSPLQRSGALSLVISDC